MKRRGFLKGLAGLGITLSWSHWMAPAAIPGPPPDAQVMTVRGTLPAGELGIALPHEHITTDFTGAEVVPQPQYERLRAHDVILPHLLRLRERGCRTLIECTPKYIGRDVLLLAKLSESSGLHILTNTGYYAAADETFVPKHAYEESADQLANRWIDEWRNGIEGTDVRPGFIKTGVGRGPLSSLERKLIRAAARTHLETGLTIAVHTGSSQAALEEIALLQEEGVSPEAFIWVHAQNGDSATHRRVAESGGWISLDGLAPGNLERYEAFLNALKESSLLHRVMVSHDDGWAVVPRRREPADLKPFKSQSPPYLTLFDQLLPRLQEAGFTKEELDQIIRQNPARAFAIQMRRG